MMGQQTTDLAPQKRFIKLIHENAYSHRVHEVFRDFCAMYALAISNAVDRPQWDAREKEYMAIVGQYSREEIARFPPMCAAVVDALEAGFDDFLGGVFMELDLGSHWHGQFFTSSPICRLMARMTIDTTFVDREIITLMEPAIGAGAMVIATAETYRDANINYQQRLHVTGIDIDITAVHMAYIQCSLLHIPAIIIHGNSLSLESWSHWFTPAHVLGLWDIKLRRHRAEHASAELMQVDTAAEPTPGTSTPSQDVREFIAEQRDKVVAKRGEQLGLF